MDARLIGKANIKETIQIEKGHALGTWLEVQGAKRSWPSSIHSSHLNLTPQPYNYYKNQAGMAFIYLFL